MTNVVDANKAGLVFGLVLGLCHLSWVILIAFGWAQPMIDFMLWLHMIKPFIVVEGFTMTRAAALVAVTSLIGYAVGWIWATLWNRVHR